MKMYVYVRTCLHRPCGWPVLKRIYRYLKQTRNTESMVMTLNMAGQLNETKEEKIY